MSTKEGKNQGNQLEMELEASEKKRNNKKFGIPNTKIWRKRLQKKKLVASKV